MLTKHVVMKDFGGNNEIEIRSSLVIKSGPRAKVEKNKCLHGC